MKTVELKAFERKEIGKKVKHLRTKGLIPAIVYGKGMDSYPVSVEVKSYLKAISGDAGENILIDLNLSGKMESVITHDIQRDPVTDSFLHVDFHKINMKEKIITKIPVELSGVSIGVKSDGGILIHSLTELEIKCLPRDIPDNVVIDISSLKIGDGVQVSDLRSKLKEEIEIITSGNELLVKVVPPAKEEVAAPAAVSESEMAAAASGEATASVEGQPLAAGKTPAKGAAGAAAEAKKPPETPAK